MRSVAIDQPTSFVDLKDAERFTFSDGTKRFVRVKQSRIPVGRPNVIRHAAPTPAPWEDVRPCVGQGKILAVENPLYDPRSSHLDASQSS